MDFLKSCDQPMVLDADALNIISRHSQFLARIPENSIITPHPKEFERLFGITENSFDRVELAREKAAELGIYIVLKDHHTQIITPEKDVFYNITGNSGMAKGGSGDVLTGLLTGILAQGYTPFETCVLGVFIHGLAGDITKEEKGEIAMIPSDIISNLPNAFLQLITD